MTNEDKETCPLCMESMEADDLAFYPCDCRYQICRFCWAKIINEENGLCPACRKEYNSEKPASYKPVTESEEIRSRPNRKRKEYMKKTKLNPEMLKILPELRVVQPNLIFVVGLPTWISKDKDILKGSEYFGRYGKIFKVEINQNQTFGGPQGQPTFSAYITYYRAEDAMRSIRDLNQSTLHGRPIRVSLGTTKYCSQFLRGTKCTKHECMYLHELGDSAASFTKEEMQAGKHTEYMNKLLQEYLQSSSSVIESPKDGVSDSTSTLSINPPMDGDDVSYSSTLKDSGNQSTSRSRSRHNKVSDLTADNSDTTQNSHFGMISRVHSQPSSRHFIDSRSGRNAVLDETRKSVKHVDKVHVNLGKEVEDSLSDMPKLNCNNSNKSNGWNHLVSLSEYSSTNSKKVGKNSFSAYSSKNSNLTNGDKSVATTISKSGAVHQDSNNRSNPSLNDRVPKPVHGNSVRTWCHPNSATITQKQLGSGEEPVDIDFDPFRESQQGLAELLAAEVAQLGVSDLLPKRNSSQVNGHSIINSSQDLKQQSSVVDVNLPSQTDMDFGGANLERQEYPWLPNSLLTTRGGQASFNNTSSLNPGMFQPNIYPPPGFEETGRGHPNTSEAAVFLSSQMSDLLNSRYLDNSYSCNLDHVGYNNGSNLNRSNGSLPTSSQSFPFDSTPLGTIGKTDTNVLSFENWNQTKNSKVVEQIGVQNPNSFYQNFSTLSSDVCNTLKQDPSIHNQPNQLMANLFAAAFNTASAMLNNNSSGICDKSSARSAPSTFDLNLFFNQLCRQSSLFSSLSTSNSSEWPSGFGTRSSGNMPTEINETSMSATAATSSPTVFSPGKYVSRPGRFPSSEDYRQHGRTTFGTDDGFANNLGNDPGTNCSMAHTAYAPKLSQAASAWKVPNNSNPASDLFQQIWRSGSAFHSFFDPTTMPPFSFHSQSNTTNHTLQKDQQQVQAQSIDSVLQPSSHPQSTE